MTKTERDEMRAFCVDARARCVTWNESGKISAIAIKALDHIDAQDAEAARLTAENDRLIATQLGDQWQGRYWDEVNKVADRDATIMAERSGAAIMLRRCREERDELGSAFVMAKAEHVQELVAVERKWMEVANRNALEREAIAEEARALAYDAGRRLEAAEAEAQKAAPMRRAVENFFARLNCYHCEATGALQVNCPNCDERSSAEGCCHCQGTGAIPAYLSIRGEARLKLYDDLRASLQSDAGAKLLAAHAEELAREKANHEDTASVRDFFENELKSVREKHGQELAAYRKALERYGLHHNTCDLAQAMMVQRAGRCDCGLEAFMLLLDPGKDLLDKHAEELEAVERKWLAVIEREAIGEEARFAVADLRRRLKAAEAEAERLRGVDLANRALCEWQKEKQDDLADMRRRLDAAEAQTATERLRADLESASATENFKAVAALRQRVDAAERLRGAWEKDFMALHSRFEAAEANLTAEKENHLAALNIILRRVQRPGSPPPGGIELAILISIRQWQEENAALHQRLEAAIAEARRTRDEEILALMQRLEAAEAETKRIVDLVRANDIAALIVDRADAIQRAEAAEKDAAAAREEIRALHQERKGEVWFWQSDEEDHLESLTCPVLIPAEALRKLLADRAVDREQDLTTIAELKRKLEKYGSHLWSCVFRIEDVPCNCGLIDAAESPDQAR